MKDYLLDLLNNQKRYEAKMEVLKNHQCMFFDQDEFEIYMKIEQDLLHMKYCIDRLSPNSKEIIVNLYDKGFSLKQLSMAMHLCKSAVFNRKEVAIRELRTLFGKNY